MPVGRVDATGSAARPPFGRRIGPTDLFGPLGLPQPRCPIPARSGATEVMVPNQQTVVLGILNPDLDGCPDARVEPLYRGQVVDRRSVSCQQSGRFQGGYLLGRLRPRGSLSPTIGRRCAAGPTGVSFEAVFAGTVGRFAWWGAEESGTVGRPPAASFQIDAPRLDVYAVRTAGLVTSIVTASGSDGVMLLR